MRLLEIPVATIEAEMANLHTGGVSTPFEQGAVAALQWVLTGNMRPSQVSTLRAHQPYPVAQAPRA